ncbi:VOC family protein [Actinoplanes sp. NPDC049316]|uniref:VOC family protein n=1 Tax=Actinoplanes sp. NPDC049316 TaxID=3154727 RepID=UPI00342E3A42
MAYTEAFPVITVSDLPAASAFYRDQMGFTEQYRFPGEGDPVFVTLALGTSKLSLAAGPAADFDLCVYADDCDAAVRQLRDAGAEVLEEPADQPWGERMARLRDPSGHRILLMAPLDDA